MKPYFGPLALFIAGSLTTQRSKASVPVPPPTGGSALVEAPTPRAFATLEVRLVDPKGIPLPQAAAIVYPASRADLCTLGEAIDASHPATLRMPVPNPGLYIVRVGAPERWPLEVPVIVDRPGTVTLPPLAPIARQATESHPVCQDPQTMRWIQIWQGYVARKKVSDAKFVQAQSAKAHHYLNDLRVLDADIYQNNWGQELLGLSQEMSKEKDKMTRSFLAICYLDLGFDGSYLNPTAVDMALRHLPEDNPFWSLSPQMPYFAYASAGNMFMRGIWLFLSRLEKKNPDPEVRAYALLRRIENHDARGEAEDRKRLIHELLKTYPGTLASNHLPSRYPHDFKE